MDHQDGRSLVCISHPLLLYALRNVGNLPPDYASQGRRNDSCVLHMRGARSLPYACSKICHGEVQDWAEKKHSQESRGQEQEGGVCHVEHSLCQPQQPYRKISGPLDEICGFSSPEHKDDCILIGDDMCPCLRNEGVQDLHISKQSLIFCFSTFEHRDAVSMCHCRL